MNLLSFPPPVCQAKAREPSHHHHREQLHFVDEYGQPITVQLEDQRGHAHRRRRSRRATECSTTTERQWEALRAMGLVEGQEVQEDGYSAGQVLVERHPRFHKTADLN